MIVERFVWKLIKRLARAERERDKWEALYKSADIKASKPAPDIVSREERLTLRAIVDRLDGIGGALGRVDSEHPLSPELARSYVTMLQNSQTEICTFMAAHQGAADD